MSDEIGSELGEAVAYQENETQAAIDAGRALGQPHALQPDVSTYAFVVPRGSRLETTRTPPAHPDFTDAPLRARGTYRPATVAALIDVIKRHQDVALTTVWVHPTTGRIVAIFNDAKPGEPAWRDHRAQLDLTVPEEWKHWKGKDGQMMSQVDFAEHIEDGLTEIVEPVGADMLELAQTFHASTDAQFRSAHRLQSGQVQVQYDETVTASAGTSKEIKIPREFKLAIPPFLGEEPYSLTALLRYRVSGGTLKLGYKLQRPDAVIRDALDRIAERLRGEFSSAVFIGEPGGQP